MLTQGPDTEAAYHARVAAVISHLLEFFDAPYAQRWLNSPQSQLAGLVPAALLLTAEGIGYVEAVVAQLMDGVYV
jgi:uncharacterized protein (DUF2384 family)